MKRILIVEDSEIALNQLATLLQEEFPDAVIHAVKTTDLARQLIEEADQDEPYDAAILDFKLPSTLGENAEVDETICLLLQSKSGNTFVAHITGYAEDSRVKQHMESIHQQRPGPPGFFLSKGDANHAVELVKNLRRMFLERELDDLMSAIGGDQVITLSRSRFGTMIRDHGITHRLMEWVRQVSTHWYEFDDVFKNKVYTRFEVDETIQPVALQLR